MMDNTGVGRSKLVAIVDSALASRKSRECHLARLIGLTNLTLDLSRRYNSDARSHLVDA
jgi:septum formation inhibitor-activating ATPase MinD